MQYYTIIAGYVWFRIWFSSCSGGEPGEDTEEFLELQEKLKNPEKMTRLVSICPTTHSIEGTCDQFFFSLPCWRKSQMLCSMSRFERAKYGIQQLVEKVGFFGILAAARWNSSPSLPGMFLYLYFSLQHSKPPVRPGRHHMWPLPCSILDILRRHPHWEGCDQDAHPGWWWSTKPQRTRLDFLLLSESLRNPSFQQRALWGSRVASGANSCSR